MQFIEVSMMGVRSARLTFNGRRSGLRVVLFPMIHLGEASFYNQTYADALEQNVVLLEGVNSPVVRRITRSYRWAAGAKKFGNLIVQPRFPKNTGLARVVHADFSEDEFEVQWRKVSPWVRWAIEVIAPIFGVKRRFLDSRAQLAKGMAIEDQPTYEELLAMSPETGSLSQAILHARDVKLIDALRAELDSAGEAPMVIAVIYGAGHMRAVVRELTAQGFTVSDSSWRTVFSID